MSSNRFGTGKSSCGKDWKGGGAKKERCAARDKEGRRVRKVETRSRAVEYRSCFVGSSVLLSERSLGSLERSEMRGQADSDPASG